MDHISDLLRPIEMVPEYNMNAMECVQWNVLKRQLNGAYP